LERVQVEYVVICAPSPGSFLGSSWDVWKLFSGGKLGRVGVPWDRSSCLIHSQEVSNLRQARAGGVLWFCHRNVMISSEKNEVECQQTEDLKSRDMLQ